jgi:hypothetical protein
MISASTSSRSRLDEARKDLVDLFEKLPTKESGAALYDVTR